MKIFGIGLSKTGTTSLAGALSMLGYKTRDYIGVTRYVPHDLSTISKEELDAYDAFTDTPIPSFYRELDAAFPGSKFILTVRDTEGWLKSCKKQFTVRHAEIQNDATRRLTHDLYGCTVFDEEKFATGYAKFVEGVKDYFKNRPQDLLVLDLCGGEGWQELCGFLGKPVLNAPFPVSNVTEIQWLKMENVIALAKQASAKSPPGIIERLAVQPSGCSRLANTFRGRWLSQFARARIAQAADKANAMIYEGLNKITPNTPVVMDGKQVKPYDERKKWSYFWLVSSFAEALENNGYFGPLTISIALVEGRRPKWGVVCIPSKGIVYYTTGEGGSFRLGRDGASMLLPIKSTDTALPLINHNDIDKTSRETGQQVHYGAAEGLAFALCAVAEGCASTYTCDMAVSETRIAAGHAILRGMGKTMVACDSGAELEYNSTDLIQGPFRTR